MEFIKDAINFLSQPQWFIGLATVLFFVGAQVRIFTKFGQGGALIEEGSPQAPLTDGLADNTHWVWGMFYVNRDDPSMMVEKRWGIGYTLNLGNPRAIALAAVSFVISLGLVALALVAAFA